MMNMCVCLCVLLLDLTTVNCEYMFLRSVDTLCDAVYSVEHLGKIQTRKYCYFL